MQQNNNLLSILTICFENGSEIYCEFSKNNFSPEIIMGFLAKLLIELEKDNVQFKKNNHSKILAPKQIVYQIELTLQDNLISNEIIPFLLKIENKLMTKKKIIPNLCNLLENLFISKKQVANNISIIVDMVDTLEFKKIVNKIQTKNSPIGILKKEIPKTCEIIRVDNSHFYNNTTSTQLKKFINKASGKPVIIISKNISFNRNGDLIPTLLEKGSKIISPLNLDFSKNEILYIKRKIDTSKHWSLYELVIDFNQISIFKKRDIAYLMELIETYIVPLKMKNLQAQMNQYIPQNNRLN